MRIAGDRLSTDARLSMPSCSPPLSATPNCLRRTEKWESRIALPFPLSRCPVLHIEWAPLPLPAQPAMKVVKARITAGLVALWLT